MVNVLDIFLMDLSLLMEQNDEYHRGLGCLFSPCILAIM